MTLYILYGGLVALFIGLSIADRNALRDSKEELKQLRELINLNKESIKTNRLRIKLLELNKKENDIQSNKGQI